MSITTARDLCTSALKLINVISATQTPTGTMLADTLDALNMMIESFNTNILDCYKISDSYYALTALAAADPPTPYTIGPTGANITATRPLTIDWANLVMTSVSPNIRQRLEVFDGTFEEWAKIQCLKVGTSIPMKLYYDRGFPLGRLYFWPYLNASATLEIFTREQLDASLTADTSLSIPPGYKRFFRFNLAVEIAPEYGVPLDEDIRRIARESKAAIESLNTRTPIMEPEPALGSNGEYGWNYLTGQ